MNSKDYIFNALRTESKNFEDIDKSLCENGIKRLLHAGMGLSTESGEFLDSLKKHIFYGKELDRVNLAEELGDIFWYCAIASSELGIDFEKIMARNIEKLAARYGDQFSQEKAQKRDLEMEREILEKDRPEFRD